MKFRMNASKILVAATVTLATSSVNASSFVGSPSPLLSPVFGTLINFDDKATGTAVLSTDYVAFGVASVTETEGLGFFGRYAGSQSTPNYIGTGGGGERGSDSHSGGWDGTIVFEFSTLLDKVGIGIANSIGDHEVLSIYDSTHTLLESVIAPIGSNTYAGFDRPLGDIKYLEVKGDFFALDDLQISPIPEPETYVMLLAGLGLLGFMARRHKTI